MDRSEQRYLRYLTTERGAAKMYRELARLTDGDRAEALNELADIEDQHAAHWAEQLKSSGVEPPADDGSLDPDDQALLARARKLSLAAVLPDLEQAERDAQGVYDNEPAAPASMVADERIHEQVLARLRAESSDGPTDSQTQSLPAKEQPTAGSASTRPAQSPDDVRAVLNNSESWHRTDKSGSLRAVVFGASDGLVSNTALVMGFAGSGIASGTVLFAGIAGLLAGAFSMGAGEYVSVASQRDVFAREIAMEAEELREKPEEEQRELELLYRAKGLSRAAAKQTAEQIMSDPDTALDTLAREELGLDPQALGQPIRVAASSFAAFTIGAAVPVIPYFFLSGTTAMILAIVLAAIALVLVGGTVGRLSGLGVTRSATRQLLIGGGAAAITFVIGRLIGAGLG
jgi:VIT1/CCC1 family predicted Fe2+/Mn2+ transporter